MSLNHWIFGTCSAGLALTVLAVTADVGLLGNNQGYEPEQPIAFSHRVHAGELGIDCQFCHFGARNSRHAGVPPASVCMTCHKTVTHNLDAVLTEKNLAESEGREPEPIVSSELQKLYDALGLDENQEAVDGAELEPIEWVRVHHLPDFVYFDHRSHVARDIACETCHGPVQAMERMQQYSDLTMGWCIDCHRSNGMDPTTGIERGGERCNDHVSTDCVTCHL